MSDEEIIEELAFNSKWLTKEYKQSKYYKEYLESVFKILIKNTDEQR